MRPAPLLAAVVAAAAAALYMLEVQPRRERSREVAHALEEARRDHRQARNELAVQARRSTPPAPVAGADAIAVRQRVLAALRAVPLRDVRLAVSPAREGTGVRVTGRAPYVVAVAFPQRLVADAGVTLQQVSYVAAEGDVRIEVTGDVPGGRGSR